MVTSDASLTDLLRRLRDRPDFRRHPLRAVGRRLWWRLRWRLTGRLWTRTWQDGLKIALPKGGPAALIYYQGHSEPETAALVRALLAPGMVFVLEPIAWADGTGGYRGEEIVVVTEGGWMPLTAYPYDPYEVSRGN